MAAASERTFNFLKQIEGLKTKPYFDMRENVYKSNAGEYALNNLTLKFNNATNRNNIIKI